MKHRFENGEILDLSEYKGRWHYDDIESFFGKEIADRILDENPYNRIAKMLMQIAENVENEPI